MRAMAWVSFTGQPSSSVQKFDFVVGAVDKEAGAHARFEVVASEIVPVEVKQALRGAMPGEADTDTKMVMMTNSTAPVGRVLQRRAIAWFPPASFSAMMPEPTTAITRKNVPSASAAKQRIRSNFILPPAP